MASDRETESRGEARRAAVAAATWEVIRQRGLSGASMREIARQAGCTTGVLTHYFRNKEELLDYAFRLAVARTWRRTLEAADHAPTGEGLVPALLEALPRDEERRLEVSVYLSYLASASQEARRAAQYLEHLGAWRELVARLVTEACALEGHDPPDDPERVAALLLAAVDGLSVRALAEPERFDAGRQEAVLRALVDRALSP